MRTRISAIRRLVNLYIEALVANADYHLQVNISDVLTEENIQVVQSLKLYPEYDRQPPIAVQRREPSWESFFTAKNAGSTGRNANSLTLNTAR
jgi:hypothetical protein